MESLADADIAVLASLLDENSASFSPTFAADGPFPPLWTAQPLEDATLNQSLNHTKQFAEAQLATHQKLLVPLAPRFGQPPIPLDDHQGRRARRTDPNRARKARQREVYELRALEAQLSAQLHLLQEERARIRKNCHSGAHSAQEERQYIPRVWEVICKKQIARRVAAEAENANLKSAIDELSNIISRLQRAAQTSTKLADKDDLLGIQPFTRILPLPLHFDTDAEVFSLMLTEVDAAYSELEGILELNQLTKATAKNYIDTLVRSGDCGPFVDMNSCHILPFDVQSTANVVWEFYSGQAKHRGPLYFKAGKALDLPHDTVVENLGIELSANSLRGDFHIRQVIRRYVEPDRTIIVWMGMVEPLKLMNQPFSSFGFRSKGYIVCEPAVETTSMGQMTYTRIRRCKRVVPFDSEGEGKLSTQQAHLNAQLIMDFMSNLDKANPHVGDVQDELMRASVQQQSQSR